MKWTLVALAIFLTGCVHFERAPLTGPVKQVDNCFANPCYNHAKLVNVLLLPLENIHAEEAIDYHHHELTESCIRGFSKFGYFNVQHDPFVRSHPVVDLESGAIDRVELGELGNEYNADGVLKVSLVDFRPFDPMRLHVKAQLNDTATGERIWAFDEVFDSDDAEVINLMRTFWNTRSAGAHPESRFEVERLRPGFFSQFVFYTMAQSYGRVRAETLRAVEVLMIKQSKEKCL